LKGITANAISHTYEVKIGIANPQSELMPGMVCKVSINNTDKLVSEEIVVPNRCVQISADGKHYVWLAKNEIAKRQFIETGELTDNGIIVTEGLSAGVQLITEGFKKVSEGCRISIKN